MSTSNRPGAGTEAPVVASADWLCVGSHCWEAPPLLLDLISGALDFVVKLTRGRVHAQRWARYVIRPADIAPLGTAPALTPVTDDIVARLRVHRDRDENQLKSALQWWDHGLRRAYIWLEAGKPICLQFLVTRADAPKLRTLPEWGAMYPPLPEGRGQVENLFAFRDAQVMGAGMRFLNAMCLVERQAGFTDVVTHIGETNTAVHSMSERVGWRRYGTSTRYWFDIRGLRGLAVCVHRAGLPKEASSPAARRPAAKQ